MFIIDESNPEEPPILTVVEDLAESTEFIADEGNSNSSKYTTGKFIIILILII